MKQKTYYKVVAVEPDKGLTSCTIDVNGAEIIYTPGEWVSPFIKGSKIFIFDDSDRAKDFASHDTLFGSSAAKLGRHEIQVWECEALNVSRPKKMISYSGFTRQLVSCYWRAKRNHKAVTIRGDYTVPVLPNTLWATHIKLTKLVCSSR